MKEGTFVLWVGDPSSDPCSMVDRVGIVRKVDGGSTGKEWIEFCWGRQEIDSDFLVSLGIDGKMIRREMTSECIYNILRTHYVEVITSLMAALAGVKGELYV